MRYSGELPQDEYGTGGANARRSPADASFRYDADGLSLRTVPRRSGRLPSWPSAYCARNGTRIALVERPKSRGRSRAGWRLVPRRRETLLCAKLSSRSYVCTQRAFCEPIQLAIEPMTTSAAPTQKIGPGVAAKMIVVAIVDRIGVAYDEMDSTRMSPRTMAWPQSA